MSDSPRTTYRHPFQRISKALRDYGARLKLFNRNVRLFLFGALLANLGMTFWMLLFNLYLQEVGFSKALIGDILSIGNLSVAAMALPAGYLAGRIKLKIQLVLMSFLSSVGFMLAILMEKPSFLIFFIVIAFGLSAFVRVLSGPFIMRNSTEKERTYIFSTLFIIFLAGGVLGNALGGWTKEAMLSGGLSAILAYRYTILIGIGASFLGLIPFLMIDEEEEPKDKSRLLKLSGIRNWNWPLFGKAFLPQAMLGIGSGLIVQFMNLYFKDIFHSNDHDIGLYMSAQATTMVLGILVAPALAERFGKVKTIVFSQLFSLPFMLILAFSISLPLALAAFVLRAALMNMSMPVGNTLVMELCRKEEQGLLQALMAMVWSSCWAISSFLYGQVLNANYTACFLIAAALYTLSSLTYYFFFRNAEKLPTSTKPAAN